MRKHHLTDCNPRWGQISDGQTTCFVTFDCPEGREGCQHTIPFRQSLEGPIVEQAGAMWDRSGNTFEELSLSPSIKRIRRYADREAALKAGCLPEYITESMFCALHVVLTHGLFEFASDSH